EYELSSSYKIYKNLEKYLNINGPCLTTELNKISEFILEILSHDMSKLNKNIQEFFENLYKDNNFLYLEKLKSKGPIMLFYILQNKNFQKIFAITKRRSLEERIEVTNFMIQDLSYVEYFNLISQTNKNTEKVNNLINDKTKDFKTNIESFKFGLNHLTNFIRKLIDANQLDEKFEDSICNFISIFLPEYHYFQIDPRFLRFDRLKYSTKSRLCIFIHKYMVLHSYISFKKILDLNMKRKSEDISDEIFKKTENELFLKESVKLRTILILYMKLANYHDYATLLEKLNEYYIISYLEEGERVSQINYLDEFVLKIVYNLCNPNIKINSQRINFFLDEIIYAILLKDENKIVSILPKFSDLTDSLVIKSDKWKENEHILNMFLKIINGLRDN
ncbi:hypothetical protein TUBRATIS_29770, partial [Tubulinosema ratisbonensis]